MSHDSHGSHGSVDVVAKELSLGHLQKLGYSKDTSEVTSSPQHLILTGPK